ncbi:hypothetical protein HOLleu_26086 [Holothuria leucospilota]|uniref:Uncharacterized protein n=1 Tax=Holothuria leucospilota TaxID=206669 RepID=A0A9Q1H4U5_HOLLE|nr:hypothetical protein HOLleu_26086 [Holothuria leucospilota]
MSLALLTIAVCVLSASSLPLSGWQNREDVRKFANDGWFKGQLTRDVKRSLGDDKMDEELTREELLKRKLEKEIMKRMKFCLYMKPEPIFKPC